MQNKQEFDEINEKISRGAEDFVKVCFSTLINNVQEYFYKYMDFRRAVTQQIINNFLKGNWKFLQRFFEFNLEWKESQWISN